MKLRLPGVLGATVLSAIAASAVPSLADTKVIEGASFESNLDLRNYSETVVEFRNATGSGPSSAYFCNGTAIFTQDLILTGGEADGTGNALTITNGYSAGVYTFTGSVTGKGNWAITAGSSSEIYRFTGDLSGFEGNWALGNVNRTIQFGDGTTLGRDHAAGTGVIQVGGAGNKYVFNYATDAMISNTINASADVNLYNNGSGAVTLAGTVNASGRIVNLRGPGTFVLSGTGHSYTSVEVVDGGTLAINDFSSLGSGTLGVKNGSTLEYGGASTAQNLNLWGNTGAWKIGVTDSNTDLRASFGGQARTGAFTKTGAGTLTVTSGSLLTSANSVTLSGGLLQFDGGSIGALTALHFDGGDLSHSDSLTLSGTGKTVTVTAGQHSALTGDLLLGDGADFMLHANSSLAQTGSLTLDGASLSGAEGAVLNTSNLVIGSQGAQLRFIYATDDTIGAWTLNGLDLSSVAEGSLQIGLLDSALSSYSGLIANRTYRLLEGLSLSESDLTKFDLTGIGSKRQTVSLQIGAGSVLEMVVAGQGMHLAWTGAVNNIWESDNSSNLNWDAQGEYFVNYDYASFDDGATRRDIEVSGDISVSAMSVTSGEDYSFRAAAGGGSITGASLTKNGAGSLSLAMANRFTSVTVEQGMLSLDAAGALGASAAVSVTGGTLRLNTAGSLSAGTNLQVTAEGLLQYGRGVVDDVSAMGTINHVDINGNTVTWASKPSNILKVSDTYTDKGSLTLRSVSGMTLELDGSTVRYDGGGVTLAALKGNGTFVNDRGANTGNMIISSIEGFTGTYVEGHRTNASTYTILSGVNTADSRFSLVLNATDVNRDLVLDAAYGNKSLYINSLSGTGNIRMDWGANDASTRNRTVDLLMSEDNTWHGSIANAKDARNGGMVVGSSGGDVHTLTMYGDDRYSNGGMANTGNGALVINNAVVVMKGDATGANDREKSTNGGFWSGDIQISSEGELVIARSDDAFNHGSGNTRSISGEGRVTMNSDSASGKATLSGDNSYSGGTTVRKGTLAAGSNTAFGTGRIDVSGGSLDADGKSLGNAILLSGGTLLNYTSSQSDKVEFAMNADLSVISSSFEAQNAMLSDRGTLLVTGAANLALSGNTTVSVTSLDLSSRHLVQVDAGSQLQLSGTLTLDFSSLLLPDGTEVGTLFVFNLFDMDADPLGRSSIEGLENLTQLVINDPSGYWNPYDEASLLDTLRQTGSVTLAYGGNALIPEPASVSLSLAGLALAALRRRRP